MKKYHSPRVADVKLNDPVFAPRIDTAIRKTIPACIRKCHETGRFEAFKLNRYEGMPKLPHFFWDSDVAKVIEGMALALELRPCAELEAELEKYVELIISAQQPDGYLNIVFTTQQKDQRWKNLFDHHELYCAGHLMEAAVAHFNATGRRNFLDCMSRYADYIASVFGHGKNRIPGYPGHEEIELALCKLAQATGNRAYFELAAYFVNERGQDPNYFRQEHPRLAEQDLKNRQAHKPVREQTDADGHAVRAVYLYSGMADVAAEFNDAELFKACENLWQSIVNHRLYVTGGIGSTQAGEAFTVDYHLPNDSVYAESCAAIGLVFFARRMLNLTGDGRYADVMEQTLYNGALSGISLDGEHFFYANLLEVNDNTFSHGYIDKTRQEWFNCSCCPTNYCRFLPQLGTFAWSLGEHEIRLDIPAAGTLANGIEVSGDYPCNGNIRIRFTEHGTFKFGLRIPGWCEHYELKLNGAPCLAKPSAGYITLDREWQTGDELALELSMPVRPLYAHGKVTSNNGRLALARGPLVYALESVDNGRIIPQLLIPAEQEFTLTEAPGLPPGTVAISGRALKEEFGNESLYSTAAPTCSECTFTAIPYALWQNRGASDMAVWIRACR
jgi:hypothetical protein